MALCEACSAYDKVARTKLLKRLDTSHGLRNPLIVGSGHIYLIGSKRQMIITDDLRIQCKTGSSSGLRSWLSLLFILYIYLTSRLYYRIALLIGHLLPMMYTCTGICV